MQKKIVVIIAILIILVIFLGLANDVRSFIRKNIVRFYAVNLSYYEVYSEVNFKLLFCATNIVAPDEGDVQFLRENFDYVQRGEIIAILSTKNGIVEITSPASGYLLKGFVNKECKSFNELLSVNSEFKFEWNSRKDVKVGSPFASIILSDAILAIPYNEQPPDTISIYISDFVKANAVFVSKDENYAFYRISDFLPEIFSMEKRIKILDSIVYGFKVPKNAIVKKNGEDFVYIVNGNVIKDLKVKIIQDDSGLLLVKVDDPDFSEFKSFIVVLTPKLFKVGEIVGNF
ncbi:MAG: hypothetical protein JHC30_04190 [Caldisericum sp.]|jgi:hypothetical protein|nr:hypothetical protein [Caldisericum sp.]